MPKRNLKTGFTLVELLVTISIFVILTGIVLFNQSKFNSTILLTNLAYDTALTVRQAQTYGINIKEFYNGTNNFSPYGVHFERGAKSFLLFADLDPSSGKPVGNGLFDGSADVCSSSYTVSIPGSKDGCVNRYNITRGNYIKAICNEEVKSGQSECTSGADKTLAKVDIVFKRPNPDAVITGTKNSGDILQNLPVVTIILGGADGVSTRKINVQANGLIQVIN